VLQGPFVEQDSPQRRRGRREDELGSLSGRVIGAAIAVHRQLGPGLLESAYEECLGFELAWNGIAYDRQVPLPLEYRGHRLDCGYRIDLVVERQLIIELKTVERILPIHAAQVLTYLRLTRLPLALLINFNVVLLKQGLRRFALTDLAFSASSAPLR
jgi:GxxExxY protein